MKTVYCWEVKSMERDPLRGAGVKGRPEEEKSPLANKHKVMTEKHEARGTLRMTTATRKSEAAPLLPGSTQTLAP